MRGSARLLAVLSIGTFPIGGYTQVGQPGFVPLLQAQVISQFHTEVVELLAPTPDLPRGLADRPATVTYRFELAGDPCGKNFAEVEASIGGFARFKIEIGSAGDISVNGDFLCSLAAEDGRVAYRFSVRRGETAKFIAGGEFPIPVGYERGRSISISYFDAASHETSSVDVLPIAVLDDRTISSPDTY